MKRKRKREGKKKKKKRERLGIQFRQLGQCSKKSGRQIRNLIFKQTPTTNTRRTKGKKRREEEKKHKKTQSKDDQINKRKFKHLPKPCQRPQPQEM